MYLVSAAVPQGVVRQLNPILTDIYMLPQIAWIFWVFLYLSSPLGNPERVPLTFFGSYHKDHKNSIYSHKKI